jgi:hypothetical protein
MSKYDLLRTIIGKSIVLSNFYESDLTEKELEELYELLKKDMDKLELEDIVFEKLNEENVVALWNFVYKYDFHGKAYVKSKIYKYVRDKKVTLEMEEKLISNQALMHKTCINQFGCCETTHNTAEKGHLECLRYLHENGCEWDENTCAYGALNGHLECVRYAHENGCPWDKRTCSCAAANGHLECLRYAHENRCPWDKMACSCAAANGHLECLRYAHENRCPWDKRTCECAAAYGHLECLRYAHENGCPWDKRVCVLAAEKGHLECLRYLHEKGCPGYEKYIDRIPKKN